MSDSTALSWFAVALLATMAISLAIDAHLKRRGTTAGTKRGWRNRLFDRTSKRKFQAVFTPSDHADLTTLFAAAESETLAERAAKTRRTFERLAEGQPEVVRVRLHPFWVTFADGTVLVLPDGRVEPSLVRLEAMRRAGPVRLVGMNHHRRGVELSFAGAGHNVVVRSADLVPI
jgi:hypothetical protein